jgi:hypothetical protein
MSGFASPREWRDLLKEQYGKWGALQFHIWIAGGTAVALSAVSFFLYGVYTKVVVPVISSFAKTGAPIPKASSWTDIALSFLITLLALGISGYIVQRWVKKRHEFEFEMLDDFFKKAVFPRLEHLEQNSASVTSVRARCDEMDRHVLRPIEPKNQYVASMGEALAGLKIAVGVMRPTVNSVGKPEP